MRVFKSTRSNKFTNCFHRIFMEVSYSNALISDIHSFIKVFVLSSNSDRTSSAITLQGLDTSQRKHHPSCTITSISSESHSFGNIKRSYNFSGCNDFYLISQSVFFKQSSYKNKCICHRHSDIIYKFHWSCSCSSFCSVKHDKVWFDSRYKHCVNNIFKFIFSTNTQLESYWFSS